MKTGAEKQPESEIKLAPQTDMCRIRTQPVHKEQKAVLQTKQHVKN